MGWSSNPQFSGFLAAVFPVSFLVVSTFSQRSRSGVACYSFSSPVSRQFSSTRRRDFSSSKNTILPIFGNFASTRVEGYEHKKLCQRKPSAPCRLFSSLSSTSSSASSVNDKSDFVDLNGKTDFVDLKNCTSDFVDKPREMMEKLKVVEEWSYILPMEDSSHNSAKIVIPSLRKSSTAIGEELEHDDNEHDVFQKSTFKERLAATVTTCRQVGKSSLWITVPMSRAGLMEDMVDLGFQFHHAVNDTAVLNVWLQDGVASKIPEYATHNVGVGALVVNRRRNEILLVRELRKNYMPWKLPTGLSELGESIDQAAEREVMEETGIRCKFHSVLSFRQSHGLAHGRSDLFFVCRLDPVEHVDDSGNWVVPDPVPQETEIEKAEWVPMEQYRRMVKGQDGGPGHPMMRHVLDAYEAGLHITKIVVASIVQGRKPNPIFYPAMSEDPPVPSR